MTNAWQIDKDFIWRLFLFLCLSITIVSGLDNALAGAAAPDGPDPIGDQLCNVVQTLQGNVARAIATIAIFVVGGGLLMGKLQWPVAMTVVVGIIIIFSAGTIISWLGGDSAKSCENVN